MKRIFLIAVHKHISIYALKDYCDAFPKTIERRYKDKVILKDGTEIQAVNMYFDFTGYRDYITYNAERFMEIVYKKKYEELKEKSMTDEEKVIMTKQIMVNQQLLKAIIILLSPSRVQGINVIKECINNVDECYKRAEEEYNEIQANKYN